jgi:hypothetical protein
MMNLVEGRLSSLSEVDDWANGKEGFQDWKKIGDVNNSLSVLHNQAC